MTRPSDVRHLLGSFQESIRVTIANLRALATAVLTLALLSLAACGGGKSEANVLNIGDQSKLLQLALERSGEAKDVGPKLRWTTFTDGPHMNAAFLAGAIDVGWMGDTPALLASAAKADVVVIAGAEHKAGSYYQIVAPPGSPIRTVADLRGKRVAFTRGTALHGFLLIALQSAGLRQADIVPVDLPIVAIASALKSGGADAAILAGPMLTGYLAENPRAQEIKTAIGGYNVVLATRKALADPTKRRLIEDFITHQARAWRWTRENLDRWQEVVFKEIFHQGPEALKLLKARGANLVLVGSVTPRIEQGMKRQAALLAQSGVLPKPGNVDRLFDPEVTRHFNAIIAQADAVSQTR
jgi:sulfonate transport system substrate-binding protein